MNKETLPPETDFETIVAVIIDETRGVELVSKADPRTFDDLAEFVGKYLEPIVHADLGLVMWVDEEGIVNGSPVNYTATSIVRSLGAPWPIHGRVLITGYESCSNADVLSPISDQAQRAITPHLLGLMAYGTDFLDVVIGGRR